MQTFKLICFLAVCFFLCQSLNAVPRTALKKSNPNALKGGHNSYDYYGDCYDDYGYGYDSYGYGYNDYCDDYYKRR